MRQALSKYFAEITDDLVKVRDYSFENCQNLEEKIQKDIEE